MMIPDKNFRMKKPFKRMVALMGGTKNGSDHLKSLLIGAQLSEEAARRMALKSKDHKSKDAE